MGKNELKIGPTPTEFFDELAQSIDTAYSGDPFMVSLNADYILEFLSAVGDNDLVRIGYAEIVTFEKDTPSSSSAICIENIGSDCRFLYIAMPYKLH